MPTRTFDDLSEKIRTERRWRRQEVTTLLRHAHASTGALEEAALCRAGVTMLYAHWEGFVREALCAYLEFVRYQVTVDRTSHSQLSAPWIALSAARMIDADIDQERCVVYLPVVEFMREGMAERPSLPEDLPVGAKSNLQYEVLARLMSVVGLEAGQYADRELLVNERLLGRRNPIAHGTRIPVDAEELDGLMREVFSLIDDIMTAIENAAALSSHKENTPAT